MVKDTQTYASACIQTKIHRPNRPPPTAKNKNTTTTKNKKRATKKMEAKDNGN